MFQINLVLFVPIRLYINEYLFWILKFQEKVMPNNSVSYSQIPDPLIILRTLMRYMPI